MAAQTVWRYGMVSGLVAIAGLVATAAQAEIVEPSIVPVSELMEVSESSGLSESSELPELSESSELPEPELPELSESSAEILSQSLETVERETDYWLAARRLLAERLRTIATIRRALLLPDPEAIATIDFDLYRNTLATDRFLREFATTLNPNFDPDLEPDLPSDCHAFAVSLDDRARVYCALANTQRAINDLFAPLSQQQDAIADLPPSTFLPGSIVIGTPGEPDRLATQAGETFDAATSLPGVMAKPPLARTPQRYTPPAYSPPPALIDQLDAIAQQLQEARRALPRAFAITLPDDELAATSAPPTASFSTPSDTPNTLDTPDTPTPNTHALTYLPSATNPTNPTSPNPTDNRIFATPIDYAPLVSAVAYAAVPGLPNAIEVEEFVPSLLLEIAGDRLEVVSLGFDFGAIADLGSVDLDALSFESALSRLDPSLRPAFADYRPPELFADLHADRQRARLGKNDGFGVAEGVATSLPAIGDRVYLFRSIQYGLPDFVETGRALNPPERQDLAQQLEVPSFDGVIAVELVTATVDGGYQVRWRLLEQFPEPQILDLYNYVNYGDTRSPSW